MLKSIKLFAHIYVISYDLLTGCTKLAEIIWGNTWILGTDINTWILGTDINTWILGTDIKAKKNSKLFLFKFRFFYSLFFKIQIFSKVFLKFNGQRRVFFQLMIFLNLNLKNLKLNTMLQQARWAQKLPFLNKRFWNTSKSQPFL